MLPAKTDVGNIDLFYSSVLHLNWKGKFYLPNLAKVSPKISVLKKFPTYLCYCR